MPRRSRSLGAEAVALDLSSLADVDRFVATWRGALAGLVNNAGLQITNATRFTQDGYEETFLEAAALNMRVSRSFAAVE